MCSSDRDIITIANFINDVVLCCFYHLQPFDSLRKVISYLASSEYTSFFYKEHNFFGQAFGYLS